MTNSQGISELVINRLPRYHRFLGELLAEGVYRISSRELSGRMGLTASQIRQDLNCFGGFGQQGYGYNIETLYTELGEILGLNETHSLIIIGAGNMGRALINYTNIEKRGYGIIGIFDNDENKIGTEIRGMKVQSVNDLESFCKQNQVDIAVLTLPKTEVRDTANRLIESGVKGLWNFSYVDIPVPDDVAVENVHLIDSLMTLSYQIDEIKEKTNN